MSTSKKIHDKEISTFQNNKDRIFSSCYFDACFFHRTSFFYDEAHYLVNSMHISFLALYILTFKTLVVFFLLV